MTSAPHDREVGSATVWILVFVMLLTAVGTAAIIVASGFGLHRKAAAAADLAALAGASRSVIDEQAACLAADEVAQLNGAELLSCRLSGSAVVLVVAVDPETKWLPTMRVAARAGYP